ncbi:hypothetical protein [Methylobacterium sp. J-067]|nr:hypothetical protein [Methylobacterium sp. J-067]
MTRRVAPTHPIASGYAITTGVIAPITAAVPGTVRHPVRTDATRN